MAGRFVQPMWPCPWRGESWSTAVFVLLVLVLDFTQLATSQTVCQSSNEVSAFVLETSSGNARFDAQISTSVASFSSLGTACAEDTSSSGDSSVGAIIGTAVGCLLAGIVIGAVVYHFFGDRILGRAPRSKRNAEDPFAKNIVQNPYESTMERVTYTNPAFNRESSPHESGESGSSTASSDGSKASAVKVTRQSSIQWPQWTGSSQQGVVKKQWRDSIGAQKDSISGLDPGVSLPSGTDVEAALPSPKKTGWFSSLFKKRPSFTAKLPESLDQEALVPKDSILPMSDMSAIMDEVDQLAKDIDDMHSSTAANDAVFGAALADVVAARVEDSIPAIPSKDDITGLATALDDAGPPPLPSMPNLDEALEQPSDLAESVAAATSKMAVNETLSPASAAMPKFEQTRVESKKLQKNPFLQVDKKKPDATVAKPELKKRLSSTSLDVKKGGAAALAEKFRQEEAAFKRPSLRSVTSKSSKSSESSDGKANPEQASSSFPKVALRKVNNPSKPAAGQTSTSLQKAVSALKKTPPELPPSEPSMLTRTTSTAVPEPLPTESQIDLEEEEQDMYIDPQPPSAPMSRSPSMPAGVSPHAAPFDLGAVTMTEDNYIAPLEDIPMPTGQLDEYIEMGETLPPGRLTGGLMGMAASSPPAPAARPAGSYMQLNNATSGETTDYLDMSDQRKPPQVARRMVSSRGKGDPAPAAKPTKKKVKKEGGFLSRLFKSKPNPKDGKSFVRQPTEKEQVALGKLRPGWRVATGNRKNPNAELPVPAPPEWVQKLHQQGIVPSYSEDDIYEEYGQEDGEMYEELNTQPRQHTVHKIAKPSEGQVLITSQAKAQAIEDLKTTPMPAGNVKRLTSHWVKKQE